MSDPERPTPSSEIPLETVVEETEFVDPSRRRQQYLTLIFGEAIKNPSRYIDTTVSDLRSGTSPIQKDYVMFGAVEFVRKCQTAVRTTSLEQAGKIIGSPKSEVFWGLRKLTLGVEIKTEDDEVYKGDVSPLHLMDLMDSPTWSQRIMTRNFEAIGVDKGFAYWRRELLNELLSQRLKNEQDQGLPKEAKIKSTNLYSFAERQRIDDSLGEAIGVSPRELVVDNLKWLHNTAWYIFCIGGRQRAWDKALEGRWPLPQMQEALLPANYRDIRHDDDLWLTRRFRRVIQCHGLWSEEAENILPIFKAEMSSGQKDIVRRKVLRRGALPHLEEEESKIALGLGEYKEDGWLEKATAWLKNEENITLKGEMKSWEEMQNVAWADEERREIAEVDFRPALERMQQFDPGVKIEGSTKGVEGYQQVVSQLSYQNLDYSRMEYHTWAKQMGYTIAASHAYEILHQFFHTLTRASRQSRIPIQELDNPWEFWEELEEVGKEAGEMMKQFANAIDVEYMGPLEKAKAGEELLWAAAQACTYHQRDWLSVIEEEEGRWEEKWVSTDNEAFPQDRRETLERLGYQFIRIGNGLERVFGPSGSPVRMLDRYEGYYCAAEEQFGGRALGWRFIEQFLGNAALQVGLSDTQFLERIMSEIKRKVPDEWPSYLSSEGRWLRRKLSGIGMLGKRRKGKRIKV